MDARKTPVSTTRSSLSIASRLRVEQEGMVAAVPRHIDEADQGVALASGNPPDATVGLDTSNTSTPDVRVIELAAQDLTTQATTDDASPSAGDATPTQAY